MSSLELVSNIWMALNGELVKYNPSQPLKFYDADSTDILTNGVHHSLLI